MKYTVEIRDDQDHPVVLVQVDAPDPAHALVWVSQGRPLVEWFIVPEGGETSCLTANPIHRRTMTMTSASRSATVRKVQAT